MNYLNPAAVNNAAGFSRRNHSANTPPQRLEVAARGTYLTPLLYIG